MTILCWVCLCTCCFSNYEHIVKTHQNQPVHGQNQVSDAAKFHVVSSKTASIFFSLTKVNFGRLLVTLIFYSQLVNNSLNRLLSMTGFKAYSIWFSVQVTELHDDTRMVGMFDFKSRVKNFSADGTSWDVSCFFANEFSRPRVLGPMH